MADFHITKSTGQWVIRGGGSVLAETGAALVLAEPGYDDVIYFPREDVGMAFLEQSETRTSCPKKGEAVHFHLTTPEGKISDVAWSYEAPISAASQIKGYLGFYAGKVVVEQL